MTHATTPTLDCAAAQAMIVRHVRGALSPVEATRFREHVLRCSGCRDDYRLAMQTAARVGRGLEAARLQRGARRERRERRLRPLRALAFGRSPRGYGIRLLLGTALFIYALSHLSAYLEPPELAVERTAGEVLAAGGELVAAAPQGNLHRGDWCSTGVDGRARISGRGASLELAPAGAVLVEDARPMRVRLTRGALVVEGRALVATRLGFARLEGGRAQVELSPDGLALTVESGALVWSSASGDETLAAGEQGVVRSPGPLERDVSRP